MLRLLLFLSVTISYKEMKKELCHAAGQLTILKTLEQGQAALREVQS